MSQCNRQDRRIVVGLVRVLDNIRIADTQVLTNSEIYHTAEYDN
ncbi:hypothetical protein SAMN05192552_103620 [Natrinema hispanicum]|uniref:Uncharacterized protein n=1 Tax=Natrinema hispanicum TaxID=392421 RepID=A0A1G6WE45_9EURY|nr:hypothetical protein SAMN05192552_103620 [Natrinema hispanicum]